jgi:transcriptional regulator GlxA family with amidase domain
MPPLITARMDEDRSQILQSTLQLLALETAQPRRGAGVVISRLADILFVQAIRAYAQSPESEVGWLGALNDRRLAPVFRALHSEVARAWTVDALAEAAGMSRSAFAARFKAQVGEAPLEYLTRWRMYRAGVQLRRGRLSIAEIAAEVGYESEAAFSKAFKRLNGVAPGEYRKTHAEEAETSLATARKAAAIVPSQTGVFTGFAR